MILAKQTSCTRGKMGGVPRPGFYDFVGVGIVIISYTVGVGFVIIFLCVTNITSNLHVNNAT